MEEVIYLSFVTASVSFTVTETKLFLYASRVGARTEQISWRIVVLRLLFGPLDSIRPGRHLSAEALRGMVPAGLFPDGPGDRVVECLSVGCHVLADGEDREAG